MDFTPQVGILIRHMYLWRDEARQGREEGRKARPCLIVHVRDNEYQEKEVYIVPVTHTEPRDKTQAIELPQATTRRHKLIKSNEIYNPTYNTDGQRCKPLYLGRAGCQKNSRLPNLLWLSIIGSSQRRHQTI